VRERKAEFVSWKRRKAWLLNPETGYAVKAARYMEVRPAAKGRLQPDDEVSGRDAALTWAREQSVKKLGPPPLENDARPGYWQVTDGGFGVRNTSAGIWFIVEGPPDSAGNLPDWEAVRYRPRRDVPGEPGLIELVAEGGDNGQV